MPLLDEFEEGVGEGTAESILTVRGRLSLLFEDGGAVGSEWGELLFLLYTGGRVSLFSSSAGGGGEVERE